MIGDEGAMDAYYRDEPYNVTLDMRRQLVRRRSTFGRTRVVPRSVPQSVAWHGRPVWNDAAVILKKRQGQAVTCGLDRNYYPEVGIVFLICT